MSTPVAIESCSPHGVLLAPRFSAVQTREDGTLKVRPIDNFSWSTHRKKEKKAFSVNGHTAVGERLHHDSLDRLWQCMRLFVATLQCLPGLLKVDVDNAFRRIPLMPDHCWAAGVAFLVGGKVILHRSLV